MAPRAARRPLGCVDYNDHRKVSPLKLGAEHVPFPCSLRELVLDRYGEPAGVGSDAHPMQLDELLDYLKNIDNFSLSPWVALVDQTEAIGDPATPSREQIAILRWLGKALEIWEKQSPLEGRVAAQVRRLKPLSAAFAVTEPSFLQPGAHPLHQLLDSIQARAVGWQARLDRVGAILEQQVTKAVDDSRQWFDNKSTNLAGICAEFSATAERDQARARRMIQRVVEAEAGKIKTAAAKQEAARMINAALQKYPIPGEIGAFIKGPWYTSAQLLLLKFGEDSEQWQKMSTTTETLLDSFQNIEQADETRRQHIFEVVTQLPKEMRRWLLSLHHDTEAVNEAMGLVEFTHLRILRRQPLELQHILPIVVEGEHVISAEVQKSGAMKNWQEGQWFAIDSGSDGILRVQLVLKVEQSQQLLFTNLAGIKVLQLGFTDFSRLLAQGKVKALHSGATFSLCLAHAVGIDSVEILDALASALADALPLPDTEPEPPPSEEPVPKAKSKSKSGAKTGAKSAAKSAQKPRLEPDDTPEEAPVQDAQTGSDPVEEILDQHYRLMPDEDETDLAMPAEEPAQGGERSANKNPPGSRGYLIEQAEEIRARGGYFIQQSVKWDDAGEADTDEITGTLVDNPAGTGYPDEQAGQMTADQELFLDLPADDGAMEEFLLAQTESIDLTPAPVPEPETGGDADREQDTAREQELVQRRINLPMGAWLGFHDGETPLMARLAVYDLENDYYIFVNRKGVKMRQVSRLELLNLVDNGLVDILETNSNFRDEVTEVRKKLDQ